MPANLTRLLLEKSPDAITATSASLDELLRHVGDRSDLLPHQIALKSEPTSSDKVPRRNPEARHASRAAVRASPSQCLMETAAGGGAYPTSEKKATVFPARRSRSRLCSTLPVDNTPRCARRALSFSLDGRQPSRGRQALLVCNKMLGNE
jgi:hypothetical protein